MDDLERETLATLDQQLVALTRAAGNVRVILRTLLSDQTGKGFFVVRGLHAMEDIEREYTLYVLAKCEGNKTQASQILKVDPSTLHRKLARWANDDSAQVAGFEIFPPSV